jgi:hypothetical protein
MRNVINERSGKKEDKRGLRMNSEDGQGCRQGGKRKEDKKEDVR